jgi:hypothetical protein
MKTKAKKISNRYKMHTSDFSSRRMGAAIEEPLEPSLPESWATAAMGDGEDLDARVRFAVNQRKGKQGNFTLWVPPAPLGQRKGDSRTFFITFSSSATNRSAARLLRSRYQRAAASASSTAAG